jgi:hypothetical protein
MGEQHQSLSASPAIADIDWWLRHVRFVQLATDALQHTASLFDHVVGGGEHSATRQEQQQ